MDSTKIEWTDATWNPLRAEGIHAGRQGWACQRVSPGCEHCYAETINKRLGTGLAYDAKGIAGATHYLEPKALTQPLRWSRGRRIFLSSMTDVFGEWVPDEDLDRMFAVMALTPQHTYQVLTKRAARMREYLIGANRGGRIWGVAAEIEYRQWAERSWPLPNVWLGVSAEDQQRADERIPELLATPAAKRFVSYEPALGPVLFRPIESAAAHGWLGALDWIIVGGESGPGARPFDIEWARSAIAQCHAAGVACFYKQGGSSNRCTHDIKGGCFHCFPTDLKVREFPNVGTQSVGLVALVEKANARVRVYEGGRLVKQTPVEYPDLERVKAE